MAGTYFPLYSGNTLIVYVALQDMANPGRYKANPTIASGDFKYSLDGAALGNVDAQSVAPAASIWVKLTITAATGDWVAIQCIDQTATAEWADYAFVVPTHIANIASNVVQVDGAALGTHASGMLPADARDILGTAISTPATAGILDVNLKNIANAAVSTSTAQLGVNAVNLGGTAQTGRDIGASVLLSTGTGTGQLDFTSGVVKANLAQILGTVLTETAGLLAGGFKKFFNVATPTGTLNSIPDAVAGAAGGLFIAGTNAATSITTALTANITGNLSGSVGSVTGNVGGNVTGSVGSMATGGIAAASFAAGAIDASAIATDAIGANEFAQAAADKVWATTTREITDKAGFALSTAGILAIWHQLTSAIVTASTIGKLIVDNLDAAISSRSTYAGGAVASVTGNVGGNVVGSVASVVGNVGGDVVGNVGGNVTGTLGGLTAGALADLFDTDSGKVYADAVAGSVVKEIADHAVGAALSVQDIVDGVWDESLAAHIGTGTTGEALDIASIGSDPWATALPGAYGAGTAGKILGDNLNATVSSRASQTSVDTLDDYVDTEVAAIKTQTDKLTFTVANQVDANALSGGGSGLDAAGVRAAVGLGSANLDTQLTALDNYIDTEVAAIKIKTDLIPASPAAVGDIPTATQNADALLKRDWTSVTGEASRSVLNALRFLRNRWYFDGATLNVTEEDDSTVSWTAAVTTQAGADPITGTDPT